MMLVLQNLGLKGNRPKQTCQEEFWKYERVNLRKLEVSVQNEAILINSRFHRILTDQEIRESWIKYISWGPGRSESYHFKWWRDYQWRLSLMALLCSSHGERLDRKSWSSIVYQLPHLPPDKFARQSVLNLSILSVNINPKGQDFCVYVIPWASRLSFGWFVKWKLNRGLSVSCLFPGLISVTGIMNNV